MPKSKSAAAAAAATTSPSPPADTLASDLIWGAQAIGIEIGVGPRRAFHILQSGSIPAKKVGALWVASRAVLRAHFIGAQSE
jgi:hypothetical protein